MSKYEPLWEYVRQDGGAELVLSFTEIRKISGQPIDHSFLNCKKELLNYGYEVGKISLKNETIMFKKI